MFILCKVTITYTLNYSSINDFKAIFFNQIGEHAVGDNSFYTYKWIL